MNPLTQIALGALAAAAVAWGAYRARALAPSGAWAALLVGSAVFGLGGWTWAGLLLLFFVSSSALSHAFARRKSRLSEKFAKGSRRDAGQVLANGLLAAAFAALSAWRPSPGWWVAFAGALAAVNADTWATELGVLAPHAPRHILTGRAVPAGTSGGVTLWGSAAALAGAALIGLAAAWAAADPRVALGVTLGGWLAAWADSFLGATVQAMYYCPRCHKETEHHPRHTCGAVTQWRRGWRWLDNDLVNFAASVIGAALAFLFWTLSLP